MVGSGRTWPQLFRFFLDDCEGSEDELLSSSSGDAGPNVSSRSMSGDSDDLECEESNVFETSCGFM